MAKPKRLRAGDTVLAPDGTRAVVVVAGRDALNSVFLYREDGETQLVTEAAYWLREGRIKFLTRKPQNVEWARKYRAMHQVPLL